MGKLLIIPTPIGNLEDITLRALRLLKSADIILAEDTRTSSKLLSHYEISKKLISYHQYNEHKTLHKLLDLIRTHESVALISDAGTPGISDPGFLLIRECLKEGIEVECLPGPTALIPALVCSGFPCDRFYFEGFLPAKKGRHTRLSFLSKQPQTVVLYESPHKIHKLIQQCVEYFGAERNIAIVRELTKVFEEIIRGSAQEVLQQIETRELKGEIVVIIQGNADKNHDEDREE